MAIAAAASFSPAFNAFSVFLALSLIYSVFPLFFKLLSIALSCSIGVGSMLFDSFIGAPTVLSGASWASIPFVGIIPLNFCSSPTTSSGSGFLIPEAALINFYHF